MIQSVAALGALILAAYGFFAGGWLGALTGLVAAMTVGSGLAIARGEHGTGVSSGSSAVGLAQRIGGVVAAGAAIGGAVLGGWKWGWLGSAVGFGIGMATSILYGLATRARSDDQEQPQDFTDYLKAGEQGDADAQFNLGVSYDKGAGVPQDFAEASKWYLKAAEQGHAKAQSNLGVLYARGEGVPQDYKLAYAWFHVAAAHGDETTKHNRDLAGAQLDPASLAEAQKLSEQYHKSYVEPFQ